MANSIRRFLKDESGGSAVEYAMILAGMAAIVATAVGILSDGLIAWAQNLAAEISVF